MQKNRGDKSHSVIVDLPCLAILQGVGVRGIVWGVWGYEMLSLIL